MKRELCRLESLFRGKALAHHRDEASKHARIEPTVERLLKDSFHSDHTAAEAKRSAPITPTEGSCCQIAFDIDHLRKNSEKAAMVQQMHAKMNLVH